MAEAGATKTEGEQEHDDQSGRKRDQSTSDWKQPQSISSILDEDDGAAFEFSRALRYHAKEARRDRTWRLITHPKDNDTWGYLTASCQQLAEIQVNREDHLPLRAGAFQDGRICCARQPDFASVNGIMPELVERTNRSDRDAHVGQKPHAS